MGSPELPTDPGQDLFPTPTVEHPRGGVESEDDDDSDVYDGYQPLALDEDNDGADPEEMTREPVAPSEDNDGDIDLMTAEVTHGDPNMPPIEPADVEIERQVWSEPRPRELQMDLDKTRTEQILKAMSTITLPNITVPDWAKGVPEERWKHELLDRINNRHQPPEPSSSSAEDPQHSKSKKD
ncbi:male-enhanced antigen 1 [Drosophila suzukii]|uniref:Male-enhanced antigen 1 n=1 Tax=Drosophila suzukii TaxID=28584 RepID=A0AB39ZZK6_DROSZ